MKARRFITSILAAITALSIWTAPSFVAAEQSTFELFRLYGYESDEQKAANTAVISNINSVEYGGLTGSQVIAFKVDVGTTVTFNCELGYIRVIDQSLKTDYGTVFSSYEPGYNTEVITSDFCTVNYETATKTVGSLEYSYILPGATITFNKPGDRFHILVCKNGAAPKATSNNLWAGAEQWGLMLNVEMPTARFNNSRLLVNGSLKELEAYNISGSNYFKLRDIAAVVSGTEKQFCVAWNSKEQLINLLPGMPYDAMEGDLSKGDGTDKSCTLSDSKLMVDGKVVSFTAYNINGNNYFKLRDLCKMFNIGVTWDSETSTIGIDTSVSYEE